MTLSAGRLSRRVLITGARGFIGRRLVVELMPLGDEILGIDLLPLPADEQRAEGYAHLSGTFGEWSDAAVAFLKAAPPERRLVFHLAGMANAGECERNHRMAYEANVVLTERVVDALAEAGGGGLIFPSSGLVYGDRGVRPFTEEDPLVGNSVYAQTKIQAEALIASRSSVYPLRALILRLSNIYGPGIGVETVVGRILAQAAGGQAVHVYDESPVRDFIYSGDVVRAFRKLAEGLPEKGAETLNISTAAGTSVAELADQASGFFGVAHLAPEFVPQPGSPRSYVVLANARLKTLTGWIPGINLPEGLRMSMMEMRRNAQNKT